MQSSFSIRFGEIADAERRIEGVVVADQQRIEPVLLLHQPGLEVDILATRNRNDAVVRIALRALLRLVLIEDLDEHFLASIPINRRAAFDQAAARTYAFRIEHDPRTRICGVDATLAVIHFQKAPDAVADVY